MTERLGQESPPLRLLLIISSLQGGGAERQLSEMANYWAANGTQVTLATWSGPEVQDFYPLASSVARLWINDCASRRAPWAALALSVRRVVRLRRLLRDSRPDAVVSFMDISNIYTILAARNLGVRVVVAERTYPALNRVSGRLWRLLRRIFYADADWVIAQTRDAARWLERKCRARVAVIPNSLRELPQLNCPREPLIIAVGRLSAEKGVDILLRAFAGVSADFPGWRVGILGDGTERRALMRLSDELGLASRVDFMGESREVERWMARASLLVHASRREGFPNVVLEAMGMGLAVISADCHAGPAELIEDGINGRLVPVDDAVALARVMTELMASCEVRQRLGREARKVQERFRPALIMEKWQACVGAPMETGSPAAVASNRP